MARVIAFILAALIGGIGCEEVGQRVLFRLQRYRAGQAAEQNHHQRRPDEAQGIDQPAFFLPFPHYLQYAARAYWRKSVRKVKFAATS